MYSFLSQKFKKYNSILDIYIYILSTLFFYLRVVLSLIFLKFMLFYGYDVVCNPIVLVVFLWSPVYRGSHVV